MREQQLVTQVHAEDRRLLRAHHHRHRQPVLRYGARHPCGDGTQHVEQREEHDHLRDHRQAAGQRVDPVFLVELHRLFVETLLVALVLLPQFLQVGRVLGHLPLGVHLLDEQRDEQQPDEHDQDHDGQAPGQSGGRAEERAEHGVYPHDDPRHHVVQWIERLHQLAPRDLGGFPGRHWIVTAGMKRMASGDAGHREPEPSGRAVLGQCGQRVRTARGFEPAARSQQRADEPPVTGDGEHQQPRRHRRGAGRTVSSTSIWHYRRAPQPAAAATC